MSYIINFSNSHKPTIVVNDQVVNTTSLSLAIYGKGYSNWGEMYQENIVKLLENFDSDTQPNNPTNGQLFHRRSYSSSDHQLQIFHQGAWCDVLLLNITQPTNSHPGQLWFDGANGYKFRDSSNTSWLKITDGMLPLSGGTLTGNVTLSVTPTNSSHLTTKGYVDTQISNNNVTLSNYVQLSGGTMTGMLTLFADPTNSYHAATKHYTDETISTAIASAALGFTPVNKSGDVMTGMLTLFADPTNSYHAATKQYVDNLTYLDRVLGGSVSGTVSFTGGSTNFSNIPICSTAPTMPSHMTNKGYVDANFLSINGGTVLGNITLSATPSNSGHLITKGYADTTFFRNSGGLITGNVSLDTSYEMFISTAPSTGNSVTNKTYVDAQIAAGLSGTVFNSSESVRGVIQLASVAETHVGADDTKAITPLKLAQYISSLTIIPSGTVNVFTGSTIPSGWLECNGSAVSRTGITANLFSVIGITYGPGDGVSTFNLPDLRGEFIRGWDHGRGVDTGRVIGSAQAEEVGPHAHPYSGDTYNGNGAGTGESFDGGANTFKRGNSTDTNSGAENRPRNIALPYIIKI